MLLHVLNHVATFRRNFLAAAAIQNFHGVSRRRKRVSRVKSQLLMSKELFLLNPSICSCLSQVARVWRRDACWCLGFQVCGVQGLMH